MWLYRVTYCHCFVWICSNIAVCMEYKREWEGRVRKRGGVSVKHAQCLNHSTIMVSCLSTMQSISTMLFSKVWTDYRQCIRMPELGIQFYAWGKREYENTSWLVILNNTFVTPCEVRSAFKVFWFIKDICLIFTAIKELLIWFLVMQRRPVLYKRIYIHLCFFIMLCC